MIDFVDWVEEEISNRNWARADFARAAGLSTAQVTRVLKREQNPGDTFIDGTARAFGVTKTSIYRRVGKLEPMGERDEWVDDMSHKLNQLPPELRETAEAIIESLFKLEKRGNKPKK